MLKNRLTILDLSIFGQYLNFYALNQNENDHKQSRVFGHLERF